MAIGKNYTDSVFKKAEAQKRAQDRAARGLYSTSQAKAVKSAKPAAHSVKVGNVTLKNVHAPDSEWMKLQGAELGSMKAPVEVAKSRASKAQKGSATDMVATKVKAAKVAKPVVAQKSGKVAVNPRRAPAARNGQVVDGYFTVATRRSHNLKSGTDFGFKLGEIAQWSDNRKVAGPRPTVKPALSVSHLVTVKYQAPTPTPKVEVPRLHKPVVSKEKLSKPSVSHKPVKGWRITDRYVSSEENNKWVGWSLFRTFGWGTELLVRFGSQQR
jgi:hypothetical protein